MNNKGFFELGLLDVKGQPVKDPRTDVSFFRARDGKRILQVRDLEFPPNKRFGLPAFPQEGNLFCEVTPSRFRQRKSDFFTLTHGETITRNLTLLRLPDKWNVRFDPWGTLPPSLAPLKQVLDNSPSVSVKGGRLLCRFVGSSYDDVDDQKAILAKTCLLNLFAKLTVLKAPTTSGQSWFSFIQEILEIGRERFIAIVNPEMGKIVKRFKENISKFPDYEHAVAKNHHRNMPARFAVVKSSMFSIKSSEEKGNVQLTLGIGKDPGGKEVLLLDADIDESGVLLRHIADVFKHKFTGGTHPFDIHEYLVLAHPDVPLGYVLV